MTVRSTKAAWTARSILMLATLLVAVPLIYQLGMSFKQPNEVFVNVLSPVTLNPTLGNYAAVIERVPILTYLGNSTAFALGVTAGQLLLAVPAAYAFSYFEFRLALLNE